MALLFMDSFDHYVTADVAEKWSSTAVSGTGTTTAIGATGRRGSGGWRWTTGTTLTPVGHLVRALGPGDTTCVLGMALSVSAMLAPASGTYVAAIRDASTIQVTLRLNSDMTLTSLRGPISSPLIHGTTSQALPVGAFTYVEWRVVIHDTLGTVDIWFNGVNVLSVTDVDTRAASTGPSWTNVVLGGPESVNTSNVSPGRTFDYDDVYILDGTGAAPWNTALGDVRVDARVPTGAGATTGWTPSAGANWAAVDEAAPNDDTDYVTAATTGLTDTYVVQDAPVAGATVLGVQVNLHAKKMDAGVCTLAPVIRHSGTDQVGTALAPGTSYGYLLALYPTNPGTGAAWTEAGFNAAEFGVRKAS